jgi:N-acetylglucosaminyl-diphospho-decaprenol L-rhamnosyltransferase
VTEVTAVIGNFEGERFLPDCLDSLGRQTRPPAETIVVDAGSSDRSVEVALAHGARVIETENLGLGRLYNKGADAAGSPLVLLANNDVAFEERCLELLTAALDEDDGRFAADPTQLDWAGARVIHARSALRPGPLLHRPLPGFVIDQTVPATAVVPTLLANGAALLARRDRLVELRFDETFYLEFEEIDLCWRAWLRGWSTVYVPEAVVRHRVGGATPVSGRTRRLVSAHHNLVRFALKCLPASGAIRVLAGELLRLPAHPRLIAPALARVALELPEIVRIRRRLRPSADLYRWLLAGQPGPPPRRTRYPQLP